MHHSAVAHPHDFVGLAEQATGADAVRVVSRELLLAGGAAVPPGLGQVGQLGTQRFIRQHFESSGGRTVAERTGVGVGGGGGGMKSTYPLLLTRNKGLEAGGDAKAQLMDVRGLVLTVDLNSDAGFQRRLIFSPG